MTTMPMDTITARDCVTSRHATLVEGRGRCSSTTRQVEFIMNSRSTESARARRLSYLGMIDRGLQLRYFLLRSSKILVLISYLLPMCGIPLLQQGPKFPNLEVWVLRVAHDAKTKPA